MKLYKIANTTYRFDRAIGALIKVGTMKDLRNMTFHKPKLPKGVELQGRPTVTSSELFHIGKKDANLNEDDVKRLHNIRNGYHSHESFLRHHPYYSNQDNFTEHSLYHSPNIHMTRKVGRGADHLEVEHLGGDSIDVRVDGRFTRDQAASKKHIKEVGNLARAFHHFTNQPSGKRIFVAYPDGITTQEQDRKAALYSKMGGFKPINPDDSSEDAQYHLFANHGSPSHLVDRHNDLYKEHNKPAPNSTASNNMPDEETMQRQLASVRAIMGL